ncbi:AIG2-like family protein [Rubripirellula amarantea]|uniref:AIG2-like family protein n=1 Tax=Rubripirellula amarantea TaxID=2527999 RepID=A0A5C5WGE0_9BACT|nr:gamma-glutamylcyclotransferase family protein [Rubripirellula amarantea]TWT49083.1 AIG2-like family protein [Rubripirellula amarantea]
MNHRVQSETAAGPWPTVSVFVYGTLKRGQCREHCWPCRPDRVQPAWIYAALHDRADYPAITSGHDRVLGEWWCFTDSTIGDVLETLDKVEGTNQPGSPNLYNRVLVPVHLINDQSGGSTVLAYAYFYASDPVRDGFARATCDDFASWPAVRTQN